MKKQAAKRDKTMLFTEHLRELRSRILCILIAYVVLVIACFVVVESVVAEMLTMADGFRFVYLAPSELLMCYMRLSLVFALVAVLPLIAYHLLAFSFPALSKRERRMILACVLAGFLFFVLGVVFAFTIMLPFSLSFLVNFNTLDIVSSSISVDSYTSFVLSMMLAFGVVFEMPVLSALLSLLGILKAVYLVKVRKYAILIIFILAAIITPPDVVSQLIMAAPMLLLYELSIMICRLISKFKTQQAPAAEAA